ncbi:MAG: NAD(P)-dependent oxidoreductase [Alphaproteobacteria bacterium]|nr:NAD(P)-dependent oxidoreductase [Alphaproteobacteria bacterium]
METVGVIGLGIMGSAIAANLMQAGLRVVGTDVSEAALGAFAGAGGVPSDSPLEVAEAAEIIVTSLPSAAALGDVVGGERGLTKGAYDGRIVIETSTLALVDKEHARDRLAKSGVTLLDCPISGTGAQARNKDIAVYGSGGRAAFERSRPVLRGFARDHYYLGEFGNGSRMKYIANLLVAVHNVAAAEALALGEAAGLDEATVLDVIRAGAGTSRMLEIRGPMMVEKRFLPATMTVDNFIKDLNIIGEFAAASGLDATLLRAVLPLYEALQSASRGQQDTAAVRASYGGTGARRQR